MDMEVEVYLRASIWLSMMQYYAAIVTLGWVIVEKGMGGYGCRIASNAGEACGD